MRDVHHLKREREEECRIGTVMMSAGSRSRVSVVFDVVRWMVYVMCHKARCILRIYVYAYFDLKCIYKFAIFRKNQPVFFIPYN